MRAFRLDPHAAPGWRIEWNIEDRYEYLPPGSDLRVRYTDLTAGAQAGTAEAWIVAGIFSSTEEDWIPRVWVRREAAEGQALESTFVAVIEPYEAGPAVAEIRRLTLDGPDGAPLGDAHVGLVVTLADGRRDVIFARDPEAEGVAQVTAEAEPTVATDAELCLVRFGADGGVEYTALCQGSRLTAGPFELKLPEPTPFAERTRNPR